MKFYDDGRSSEFRASDPGVLLAHVMRVGQVFGEVSRLAPPEAAPIGALVIDACTVYGDRPTEITVLFNWQQLAALQGQIRVWLDDLPVDRRDQAASTADEYERIARSGS